jgi:hypothetical protein
MDIEIIVQAIQLYKAGSILCSQSVDRLLHTEAGVSLGHTLVSPGSALTPSLSVRTSLSRMPSYGRSQSKPTRADLEEGISIIEFASVQATQHSIIRVS